MRLAAGDRERCYFHLGLGTGAGIPELVGQLEFAMDAIRSQTQATYIGKILDRCDYCWDLTLPGNLNIGRTEIIAGDLNRSIQQFDQIKDHAIVWEVYLTQVDDLSYQLRVDNFRRLSNPRFSAHFSGGEYIQTIPGPNDTATGSSITVVGLTGGGIGIPAY